MPGRAREDAEVACAAAVVERRGPQGEHLALGGLHIPHLQVQVLLLRVPVITRPLGRLVPGSQLKGEARPAGDMELVQRSLSCVTVTSPW